MCDIRVRVGICAFYAVLEAHICLLLLLVFIARRIGARVPFEMGSYLILWWTGSLHFRGLFVAGSPAEQSGSVIASKGIQLAYILEWPRTLAGLMLLVSARMGERDGRERARMPAEARQWEAE